MGTLRPMPVATLETPAASTPARPLETSVSAPLTPLIPHSDETLQLLDDPQEWAAFSRRSDKKADCWESSIVIEGMHCAACSFAVEDALAAVPGVVRVQVSAATHRAKVVWSAAQVQPSAWMRAVQQRGYRAVPANDVFASEQRRAESRKALWRWLVAGLCMMQVMMYAYPAYTAQPGDLTMEMEQLLRWASWVLSLPVMLFSCGPFFRNAWRDLRQGSISMDLPVSLGIAITFAVSTVGTFEPTGTFGHEVYFDSLTMFVFFLLTGRWLELRLRDRTAGSLEVLMNRLPESVERRGLEGTFERVAVRRLVVGDVVRVHPGEAFAADGMVEQGETLVDEALLTGESHALNRNVGDQVVAGSHNLSSTVQVRVQALGEDTRFGQIVGLMQSASVSKPRTAQLADRLAKPFLVGVLLAAGLACLWWWPTDPERALMVAVAVLVVTCPCALSLATPAAMLAAAGNMARSGVLVRNLQALEALSEADTVVFDKTGTLTRELLVLGNVTVRGGASSAQVVQMAAALARHSLHPASKSILAAAEAPLGQDAAWSCEGVTEHTGLGIEGLAEAQGLAHGPVRLRLGSAVFCGVSVDEAAQTPRVYLSDAQGWMATFELLEAVREDAAASVEALRNAGLQVHLFSGDGAASVQRVASALGIADARSACTPSEKLAALKALQSQGRSVLMVGDGLNDGPVLAGAHVSFTFGNAVHLTQAQSDFVVLGGQLQPVVHSVLLSRQTVAIVRQNLTWALLYNAACVPLAVVGWLPAWLAGLGMACSSLVVVANALRLTRTNFSREGT
jgi:Cu2+-exporting ATPase